jgi:hypothetical protein
MPRRLPEDPAKRRLQVFKRIYTHLGHFRALLEAGEMDMPGIVTIPGTDEEVYLSDLMVGIDSLPPRQREAFSLICLEGYTETDATKLMLPDSKWPTPVQQYADSGLQKMVQAYDDFQAGAFVHTVYQDRKRKPTEETECPHEDGPRPT